MSSSGGHPSMPPAEFEENMFRRKENGSSYASRAEAIGAMCQRLHPGEPSLSLSEFWKQADRAAWTILDVRTPYERQVSVIPGSIGVNEFEVESAGESKTPVLVYCTVGCRSGAYVKQLLQRGVNAYSLRGGVLAWAAQGKPFAKQSGEATWDVQVGGGQRSALAPQYKPVG